MKLLKFGLRFWLTITSLISFLTGWILLAHAPKPVSASSSSTSNTSAVPTLAPLQPLNTFDFNDDEQNQSSFNVQPQFQQRPSFRSGGS